MRVPGGWEARPMTHDAERAAIPPIIEPVSCSPAAERMRLHRERRRQGLRCLTIELHEMEIDELIRQGKLNADARNDPSAVCMALYAHFERTLRPEP